MAIAEDLLNPTISNDENNWIILTKRCKKEILSITRI